MNNLILYLVYHYSREILEYFIESTKNKAKENSQNIEKKYISYTTHLFMEEEEIEDGVGFKEVKVCTENQKRAIKKAKKEACTRLVLEAGSTLEKVRKDIE